MAQNISLRSGRVPSCRGCVRKITLGLVLATCLLFFTSAKAQETSSLDCHMKGTDRWCIGPDGKESLYPLSTTVSGTPTSLPATTTSTDDHDHASETTTHTDEHDHETETLTNCHSHDGETWCTDEHGEEVLAPAASEDEETNAGENCHFHAGVEICGEQEEITDPATQCVVTERDYNKKLRIGTIFIILATSSLAVFGPIILARFTKVKYTGLIFTIIKQFGTGVIVATAFIHLLTEGQILFNNRCVGELGYESVCSAIAMAGIFSAFLVEYIGDRILQARAKKHENKKSDVEVSTGVLGKDDAGSNGSTEGHVHNHVHTHSHGAHSHGPVVNDKLAVMVMEAGIIFHSILIGITLAVTGDSVFATLLVVVVFHQMFEGLALGTRIAMLPQNCATTLHRFLLAGAFALITPIGMAIGVGVLNKFNGNDKHTLIAMATLDALSAGILVWVGVVEMWAADWLNGDMRSAGVVKTVVGFASLMGGMALMGLLGKWA